MKIDANKSDNQQKMIVEEVYEADSFYNVAVRSENHQRLFLLVPNNKVVTVDEANPL